ncbi:MAG: glycerol kinase GlpK [Eubacterium sp.]|nr:glycerol kinase GlpK [Eubacterium sp.]
MKKYIMAIDEGTTSTRTILVDHDGQIVAQVSKEFEQIFPQPGWVEHNAKEIWEAQKETILGVLDKAQATLEDVESIGITNQRETTVVWDKTTGEPVYNAIVWQCRRTSDMVDELVSKLESEGRSDMIPSKTGLRPDAYFSATKIKWILDKVGYNENLIFGTIDSWLIWNLTGGKVHATDYTNASRTMLFNIHTLDWDDELLDLFDIPRAMLPEVKKSCDDYGTYEGIQIAGVAGDQQAALFGQCCFDKGDVKNTYGTGGFLMMNTGSEPVNSKNGLLTTMAAFTDEPEYALEGSVFVSGAAIQWLRDELKIIDNAPASEEAALSVEDSGGVYVVPAFTGLGAPHWNQDARGMIVGLTRGTSRNHLIRATLESLAYQTNDVLGAMVEDLGSSIDDLNVDGGACANNYLVQFQSDISKIKVVRPKLIESTGIGAAYLAGLYSGFWKDKDELKTHMEIDKVFEPSKDEAEVAELVDGWNKAVKCTISFAE